MDRAKPQVVAPDYIPSNVTVGEFLDRIEPHLPRDAQRRLRELIGTKHLSDPMPQ